MVPERILEIVRMYRSRFIAMDVAAKDYPHDELIVFKQGEDPLAHCCGMLPKIEILVHQGRTEEARHWLGFVEGCLWISGIYCLDDLHNYKEVDEEPHG